MTTAELTRPERQIVDDVLTWPTRKMFGIKRHGGTVNSCLFAFMTFAFWSLAILIPIIYLCA